MKAIIVATAFAVAEEEPPTSLVFLWYLHLLAVTTWVIYLDIYLYTYVCNVYKSTKVYHPSKSNVSALYRTFWKRCRISNPGTGEREESVALLGFVFPCLSSFIFHDRLYFLWDHICMLKHRGLVRSELFRLSCHFSLYMWCKIHEIFSCCSFFLSCSLSLGCQKM